jgi:LysM repeat protein
MGYARGIRRPAAYMSNPFLTPGTPAVRLEMQRQERFRLGVYCTLAALGVFLGAMLFQGCQKEQANSPSSQLPGDATSAIAERAVPAQLGVGSDSTVTDTAVSASNQVAQSPAVSLPGSVPEPTATNMPLDASQLSAPEPAVHAAAAPSTSTVRRGDTLTKIARTHHTTVAAIKSANSLKTDRIVAGTRITLPVSDSSVAPK